LRANELGGSTALASLDRAGKTAAAAHATIAGDSQLDFIVTSLYKQLL